MNSDKDSSTFSFINLAIAGIRVRLACDNHRLTELLRGRYRDFLSDGQPYLEAVVTLSRQPGLSSLLNAEIEFQGSVLRFTAPGYQGNIDVRAGRAELQLSTVRAVEEVEYFLRIIYAVAAYENGGLLFHAAGIVKGEQAYLFFGHSGSGKTTAARLSKHCLVLNDDLLLLLPGSPNSQDQLAWSAYATPFWNPTQVRPAAAGAPIAGLYRLVQDEKVYLEPMSKGQALAELIANFPVIPDDPGRNESLISRALSLLRAAPAYRLHFLPDDSFWNVIDNQ
jgi:hypothetical protein